MRSVSPSFLTLRLAFSSPSCSSDHIGFSRTARKLRPAGDRQGSHRGGQETAGEHDAAPRRCLLAFRILIQGVFHRRLPPRYRLNAACMAATAFSIVSDFAAAVPQNLRRRNIAVYYDMRASLEFERLSLPAAVTAVPLHAVVPPCHVFGAQREEKRNIEGQKGPDCHSRFSLS